MDNQESPTCARGGSRRSIRHRWREALKVVLPEVATGKGGGKVVEKGVLLRSITKKSIRRIAARRLPGR